MTNCAVCIILITQLLLSLGLLVCTLNNFAPSLKEEATNIGLLFTTYNTEDRHKMTAEVLSFYSDTPRSSMYIVDSSNHGVPDALIDTDKQFVFDQSVQCGTLKKTQLELCSLNYAFQRADFGKRHTHVIKITGKYKIPNLYAMLCETILPGTDLVLQHSSQHHKQHTEILGFRVARFPEIFRDLQSLGGNLETRVFRLLQSNKYVVQRLDKLRLEPPFYRRGNNSVLQSLNARLVASS